MDGRKDSPGGRLILVTGGARSGKSTFGERYAARLAEDRGRVTYVATSLANDPEMAARVAAHRAARPAAWATVEAPVEVAGAVRAHASSTDVFLLDCVTFWVTNLLFAGGALGGDAPPDEGFNYDTALIPADEERAASGRVTAAVDDLLSALDETGASLIAVTNEVGLGVVPEYPLARLFRDELGRANQRLARAAAELYLLVAGHALDLKRLSAPPFDRPDDRESPSKEPL
jgi:adenosylcobinamide kinase/adenosylcobinamide-phosphate guanylyltransferase